MCIRDRDDPDLRGSVPRSDGSLVHIEPDRVVPDRGNLDQTLTEHRLARLPRYMPCVRPQARTLDAELRGDKSGKSGHSCIAAAPVLSEHIAAPVVPVSYTHLTLPTSDLV